MLSGLVPWVLGREVIDLVANLGDMKQVLEALIDTIYSSLRM